MKEKGSNRAVKWVENTFTPTEETKSSVVFSATFPGKFTDTVLADIGSGVNLIDIASIEKMQASGAELQFGNLAKPANYSLAVDMGEEGESLKMVCKACAYCDVELHVWYCRTLIVRNVLWMVTEQLLSKPLLDRPTLEALGFNTKVILAAAAERLYGEIDLLNLSRGNTEKIIKGKIALVFNADVFHSEKGVYEHSTKKDDDWLNFGVNSRAAKCTEMDEMLQRGADNGKSVESMHYLHEITNGFYKLFCIRLALPPPFPSLAIVEPMHIELMEICRPIRAKQLRYPLEKWKFMQRVVAELESYGLIKSTTEAEWVAALPIFSIPLLADFRLTIDLRPYNAIAKSMMWPKHNFDSETRAMQESKFYASVDFPSSFWQLGLHENFKHLHAFMTENDVYMPTRTLQNGRNSA